MRKIFKLNLKLLLIVLVAFILRFYGLGSNPPSLTWDEAAWGYNAYSLGIDGKDEFGKFLPYAFLESFGDFKPPLYAYLDVLPIKLFGLNEFAIRFPSAFFGVLTVVVTYFLTKRIFYQSINAKKYSLLAALFLAISPWHIMLSRAAFEANIASFFLISGIWSFLLGVQQKAKFLILSAVLFALSLYTFNTSRIVVPILVLILVVIFIKTLLKVKKTVFVASIVGIIMVVPIIGFLFSSQASLRFEEVNIFSDIGIIQVTNQQIANDGNAFWSKIIHNRRFAYGVEYLSHYFDNLSPKFLFLKGDGNPKFSTQDVGEMYLWDISFVILGALWLFKKKEGVWWIIPLWLLVGIIPAATARETPHALRIEATLPTFQMLTAYGFVNFMSAIRSKIKNIRKRYFIFLFLILLLMFNFIYFIHGYITHYPREFSREWQYGYKESIEYVKSVEKDYDLIQVTSELGRPYIYYLLYIKVDPKEFRKNAIVKRDVFGFVKVDSFGKYEFTQGSSRVVGKKVLYIDLANRLPVKAKALKTFYLLNGEEILVAYIYPADL